MAYPVITRCTVCGDRLQVTCLHCSRCRTKYDGQFHLDKFSYLSSEQKGFIEVFLKCRGNIKEVEKELNISYPTVRGRLDDVISALGYEVTPAERTQKNKQEILEQLSKGEITYEEAMKRIKE